MAGKRYTTITIAIICFLCPHFIGRIPVLSRPQVIVTLTTHLCWPLAWWITKVAWFRNNGPPVFLSLLWHFFSPASHLWQQSTSQSSSFTELLICVLFLIQRGMPSPLRGPVWREEQGTLLKIFATLKQSSHKSLHTSGGVPLVNLSVEQDKLEID